MKSMMRRFLTLLSILYLLTLTLLAFYALRNVQLYSLPISTTLSALTIALPPLTGFLLALSDLVPRYLNRSSHHIIALRPNHAPSSGTRHVFAPILLVPLAALILSTILGTLASTHIGSTASLTCGLQMRWTSLFKAKSATRIAQIQDALSCCGFRTSRDMAFPFPDRNHGADACERRFERVVGCLEGLAEVERASGWVMVGVCVGVVVWLAVVVIVEANGEMNGMGRVLGDVNEDVNEGEERGIGRRIEYRDNVEPEDENHRGEAVKQNGAAKRDGDGAGVAQTGSDRGHVHISDLVDDGGSWATPTGR